MRKRRIEQINDSCLTSVVSGSDEERNSIDGGSQISKSNELEKVVHSRDMIIRLIFSSASPD